MTPTASQRISRRPAQSATTHAIRTAVARWGGRNTRVLDTADLASIYRQLMPHADTLSAHSSGAIRLLHNATAELTKRGELPC